MRSVRSLEAYRAGISGHYDPCTPEDDDVVDERQECDPQSQVSVNIRSGVLCLEEEASQETPASSSGLQASSSQQPSFEFLESLGVKVRDFAYEGTLPAIAPVPRVPRQVQPEPTGVKRRAREWDADAEREENSDELRRESPPRKSRSLERRITEPLDAVEEMSGSHVRSLVRPSIQVSLLPLRLPKGTWDSPPTSPITPMQFASPDSKAVETPLASPFNIQVEDTSMIPASQLDSESQGFVPPEPVSYSQLGLSPQAPLRRSSASPMRSGDPPVRQRRGRNSMADGSPKRYELRCRTRYGQPYTMARKDAGSPTQPRRSRRMLH